jgi:hypothetical protein
MERGFISVFINGKGFHFSGAFLITWLSRVLRVFSVHFSRLFSFQDELLCHTKTNHQGFSNKEAIRVDRWNTSSAKPVINIVTTLYDWCGKIYVTRCVWWKLIRLVQISQNASWKLRKCLQFLSTLRGWHKRRNCPRSFFVHSLFLLPFSDDRMITEWK